jgi:GNAT superfamily N-acetyltransferase
MGEASRVCLLSSVPQVIPELANWYRVAWPAWFANHSDAEISADLRAVAKPAGTPFGMVALDGMGVAMGLCSVRDEPFKAYPDAGPWLRGLFVHPRCRGLGVAGQLLAAAEVHAAHQGVARLYAATHSAIGTFERAGWLGFDQVQHEAETLVIFARQCRQNLTA